MDNKYSLLNKKIEYNTVRDEFLIELYSNLLSYNANKTWNLGVENLFKFFNPLNVTKDIELVKKELIKRNLL